jgi:hypothetical protein
MTCIQPASAPADAPPNLNLQRFRLPSRTPLASRWCEQGRAHERLCWAYDTNDRRWRVSRARIFTSAKPSGTDRSLGVFQPCLYPPGASLQAHPSLYHAITLLSRPQAQLCVRLQRHSSCHALIWRRYEINWENAALNSCGSVCARLKEDDI